MMGTIFDSQQDLEAFYVGDHGDYEISSTGLRLDTTPRTKALLALKAKRGFYWFDKTYGSRFHTIKTLEDGQRLAQPYAEEALQFMIDRGEILSVRLHDIEQAPDTGTLKIHLGLEVSKDDIVDIIVQREVP